MVPAVRHKVAETFELAAEFWFRSGQGGFQLGVCDDGQRRGIHDGQEPFFSSVRVFFRKKAVIDADFSVHRVFGAYPVNGGAALYSFRRVGADGAGNVFAEDFRDSL